MFNNITNWQIHTLARSVLNPVCTIEIQGPGEMALEDLGLTPCFNMSTSHGLTTVPGDLIPILASMNTDCRWYTDTQENVNIHIK